MTQLRRAIVFGLSLLTIVSLLAVCSTASSAQTGGKASYSLGASALTPSTVVAGNTATSTITLTPANGYTGTVTLSCSSVTGNAPPPTCAFNPPDVSISGTRPHTSTLTVSSTNSTPGGNYTITVTGADALNTAPSDGPQKLALTMSAVIQHIVVIFQENRTPDNLFQDPVLIANHADIASSGLNSLGQTIALTPIDLGTDGATPQNYDLDHSHKAFVSMYDAGKMDGADRIQCTPRLICPPNPQFKHVLQSDVQPYFALAEQYTFGDRMFQTNEGPSFPAHQFILSGTSAPATGSNLFASENPSGSPTGCIAHLEDTVLVIDPFGKESSKTAIYPCFDHPTLTDELDSAGISWRYYTPFSGNIWTAPVAIQHICQQQTVNGKLACTGPDWVSNVVVPEKQVLLDIAGGQLAQVTWVVPDGAESDHAGSNDGEGPSWVSSIVNAIGTSAYWQNTSIIITWDDWGGWYDHVPPIKVIDDGVSWGSGYVYGFRVPLVVVGPYAKTAYISHVNHDFGSILKYIETTFNLSSLGYADEPADDLSDCFNMTQSPNVFKFIASVYDVAHFINDKRPRTPPDDD